MIFKFSPNQNVRFVLFININRYFIKKNSVRRGSVLETNAVAAQISFVLARFYAPRPSSEKGHVVCDGSSPVHQPIQPNCLMLNAPSLSLTGTQRQAYYYCLSLLNRKFLALSYVKLV